MNPYFQSIVILVWVAAVGYLFGRGLVAAISWLAREAPPARPTHIRAYQRCTHKDCYNSAEEGMIVCHDHMLTFTPKPRPEKPRKVPTGCAYCGTETDSYRCPSCGAPVPRARRTAIVPSFILHEGKSDGQFLASGLLDVTTHSTEDAYLYGVRKIQEDRE